MERPMLAIIGLVILAAIDLAINTALYSDPNFTIISMSTTAILSMIAASAAYYAFTCHGLDSSQGKSLFYMFIGSALWTLAEISWAFDTFMGQSLSSVTSIDITYYLGYAFLLYGFFLLWKLSRSENTLVKGWLVFIIAMVIMLGFSFTSIGNIIADQERAMLEKIVNIGYPLMDYILLASGLSLVFVMQKTKQTKAWILVVIGFSLTAVADLIYAMTVGTVYLEEISEILWQFSYIFIALGFIIYYKSIKSMTMPILLKKKTS